MAYKIVRNYFKRGSQVIVRGLTLEEARKHCKDDETSSSTCTKYHNRLRTKRLGPWFDGYTKE